MDLDVKVEEAFSREFAGQQRRPMLMPMPMLLPWRFSVWTRRCWSTPGSIRAGYAPALLRKDRWAFCCNYRQAPLDELSWSASACKTCRAAQARVAACEHLGNDNHPQLAESW